ncbi:unnamed protein product [Albugo candida]|uniref:Uncharacterized protein n=1 Tax=Albugo candida TaxID=65357 RepID=A0A024G4C2_9STRA|nr:unnamed protein product [Albugo candida]|eukprot:CCI41164.1 unnamed protein product [Albugo candida]
MYTLNRIPFEVESGNAFEVIDAVTVCTVTTDYAAIACIEFPSEQILLQIRSLSLTNHDEDMPPESIGSIQSVQVNRFQLDTAPSRMVEIKASTLDQVFTGILVFTTDDMMAFGSITPQGEHENEFVRLTNDQLYAFLPEIKSLRHPVVTTEFQYVPEDGYALCAFGCADGAIFIMRYQLVGERELRSLNITHYANVRGPLTCVRLWRQPQRKQWNLLVTSNAGYVLNLKDIENDPTGSHILPDRGLSRSILTAMVMDVTRERWAFFVGTDDYGLVRYGHEIYMKIADSDTARSGEDVFVDPQGFSINDTCGSVYSLARSDLNGDGVDEIVIACSAAIYIFEMNKDGDYFGAESTQSTEVHNNKHFPVETILCALSSDISELFEKDTM